MPCSKLLLHAHPTWCYQRTFRKSCLEITINKNKIYQVKHRLCQSPPGPVAFSAKNTDFPQRGQVGAPPNFGGIINRDEELFKR